MDNHQMNGFSFNEMDTLKLNVTPTFGNYTSNEQILSISRPSVHFATDINVKKEEQSPPATIPFEDQPSWVDDLLDEPDVPVNNKSVHRRSQSDSVTYLGTDCRPNEGFSCPTFDFQKSSYYKNLLHNSISHDDQQQNIWASANGLKPQNLAEFGTQNTEISDLGSKSADAKQAKQHNARRSRVRKVQYIAELERSVQVLHTEGSLVSAELEFLDHQNLILSMENRALKQRLENLSQVQAIKSLEQDVLEREMVRLQYLYQQQNICIQQQQQLPNLSMPRRVRSCNDFESQFANHSLRPKEAGSSSDVFRDPQHQS